MSFLQNIILRPVRLVVLGVVLLVLIIALVATHHNEVRPLILNQLKQRYEQTHFFHQTTQASLELLEAQQPALPPKAPVRRPSYHGFSPYFKTYANTDLEYREIWARSTTDGTYFNVYFSQGATKPNIIPHPSKPDWYLLVATDSDGFHPYQQLECLGSFFNGVLLCEKTPSILPVNTTNTGACTKELEHYNMRPGPRNSRVFYSPDGPLISYNAQSKDRCMGFFVRDIRTLLPDFTGTASPNMFTNATEIQRPTLNATSYNMNTQINKDFMLFWDRNGTAFVQHEIWPTRVFAQLGASGDVGPNLAQDSLYKDKVCSAKYMPIARGDFEWIRPGTNALSVTLCRRSDEHCVANDKNTFIMHVIHHERLTAGHATYEPYVVLFESSAPFSLYAISQRPLWIRGRGALTKETGAIQYSGKDAPEIPEGQLESFETTSISWMGAGQRYHGYMDDAVFLSFGVEDSKSAGSDTIMSDLLQDLAFC